MPNNTLPALEEEHGFAAEPAPAPEEAETWLCSWETGGRDPEEQDNCDAPATLLDRETGLWFCDAHGPDDRELSITNHEEI